MPKSGNMSMGDRKRQRERQEKRKKGKGKERKRKETIGRKSKKEVKSAKKN